ncbi:ankyrin repeat domain-containing protein 40 [Chamaea fasciata]|uniref:ankyrin repeat domain-containing protein 40 n=1 Tax=Chamaea fasciata TaxID=190680 RepID=UPI00336A5F7B
MREAGGGCGEMAERERQERLREAAALGDAEEVRRLVELGVGLNSQNEVNGWTCLHWACKRNHAAVVAYLLHAGADKNILTKKGERPAQLTSKREIRKMLGVEDELTDFKQDSDLPIIPNYLANPPFPYVYNTSSTSIPDPTLNGNLSHLEPQDTTSPSIPDSDNYRRAGAQLKPGNIAPEAPSNGDIQPLPRGSAGPSSHPNPVLQRAPAYQGSVSWGTSPSPAGSSQSLPQQGNSSCMGPVPAFQPIFFTGAFPLNMQELVLKVRIQTPNLRENDFIEIELDRQELTYKELLRVSCRELGVNPEHVQKIRKLPNTMLRKDKDVARLQDFQELELVLTVSDKNLLFRVSTLSEQSGYNKKASELTY